MIHPQKDLYHFSSLVPKVKKSIKKYQKTYNYGFLSSFLQEKEQGLEPFIHCPPRFLQPVSLYRFYSDYFISDSPSLLSDEDFLHPFTFHLSCKTINRITMLDTLKIDLQENYSKQWDSLDLLIERLNTLGDKEAHNLALDITELKQHNSLKEIRLEKVPNMFSSCEKKLSVIEMRNYETYNKKIMKYFTDNQEVFLCKIKKVFHKNSPLSAFGFLTVGFEFNSKCVELCTGKKINELDNDSALDLIYLACIHKKDFFSFTSRILNVLRPQDKPIFASERLRTCEDIKVPCKQDFLAMRFSSLEYDEINVFISYSIDKINLEHIKEVREKKAEEMKKKNDFRQAELGYKYKKINKNKCSNSFKQLCILYYGGKNNMEETKEENEKRTREEYWKNIDQSKVCNYRLINNNPFI